MRRVAILILAFMGFWVVAQAETRLDPATMAKIDTVFADYARSDTPGYALGIVLDGRLIFAKGYGQANLDDQIPITPRTAFHLASLSKQFTASAIALLILDGKVSLEDPVAKYIPEAAKYGPDLKLKHLIYMTSGLHEYTDVPRKSGAPWQSFFYFTRDEAITAALTPDKLIFKPGSRWAYCNVNYMLLTHIVEVVSGQSFASFMQTRVFGPLKMTSTHIDDDATAIVPHRATGYALRSPDLARQAKLMGITLLPGPGYARLIRNSPHFGGSGVFSTLEDLAAWDANWTATSLAAQRFTDLMTRRIKFDHDKDNDAFGLVFGTFKGRPMIWYAGEDIDASTYMVRFPAQNLTVICLSNLPAGDAEGRAKAVLDLLITDGVLH